MFFDLSSSVTCRFRILSQKLLKTLLLRKLQSTTKIAYLNNSYLHNFGHKSYHKWQGNVFDKIITRRYSKYSQVFVRKRPLKVLPAFEAK